MHPWDTGFNVFWAGFQHSSSSISFSAVVGHRRKGAGMFLHVSFWGYWTGVFWGSDGIGLDGLCSRDVLEQTGTSSLGIALGAGASNHLCKAVGTYPANSAMQYNAYRTNLCHV